MAYIYEMLSSKKIISCAVGAVMLVAACKHDPAGVNPDSAVNSNFPGEVAVIFEQKCAVAGCHNQASHSAAGGLLLDSWEHLFEGSNNGAVVIPYSSLFSSLLYFVNVNEDSGLVEEPTMPVNGDPLSPEEYGTLRQWIDAGAPDANGNIPFGDRAGSRQKIYAAQTGCDVLTVIDAESNLVMRYLYMGNDPAQETMTGMVMSPTGEYLYICYYLNNILQKIDTRTDKVVQEVSLQDFFWHTMTISDDGSKLMLCSSDDNSVRVHDANTLQQIASYKSGIKNPRAIVANNNADTLYVSSPLGNTIYKIASNNLTEISLDDQPASTNASATSPNPWSIKMLPNNDKFFVTCAQTNDIRVISTTNDSVIKIIPVGTTPQQMAISDSKPYVFVTCMNDPSTAAKSRGSVYVINYETLEVVKKIQAGFFEPYGITVDDEKGIVYVISKNASVDGPAPHHGSLCNGRNGFYQILDLNTLELQNNKRYEILAQPTETAIRF